MIATVAIASGLVLAVTAAALVACVVLTGVYTRRQVRRPLPRAQAYPRARHPW